MAQVYDAQVYDEIGAGYSHTRRADPRIVDRIEHALGPSESVVNVGAGAGSYEPEGRRVVAVDPSAMMLGQRAAGSAPAVQGFAEALPLADDSFDAALAVLTVHHWRAPLQGLAEMRRVARDRVVILTWDQGTFEQFWLVDEYLPCLRELDRPRAVPLAELAGCIGADAVIPVPVPHDCTDGFLGAFWRRPSAYLDPHVRAAISAFAQQPPGREDEGLARLAADLEDGAWLARHGDLVERDELDLGYRLLVAHAPVAA